MENLEVTDCFEDPLINGRKILILMLKKKDERVNWINLDQERDPRWALVNTSIKLLVP